MPEKQVPVLIITYYWPPSGGAGVQRWLKFSKYFPEFGLEPIILTVDPEYAAYPSIDNSLEAELSSDVKIYKTRTTDYFRFYKKDKTKIPTAGFANSADNSLKGKIIRFVRGNFFIPDPRIGWNRYAFKEACDIIETSGIKYVITTSPPHSTQLIGLKIKNKYPEIKWIADLRDPWTDIYYYHQFYPTFFSKMVDRRFETRVLQSADKIITVGKSLKDLFASKIKGIENKIEVITNGFDEDDFKGMNSTIPDNFTISHIGTLSDAYPINGLLDALVSLQEKGNDFRLKFVGMVSSKQKELILSKFEKDSVEFIPYVNHQIAIRYMLETNALILIIPDHKSNKGIITGKIFEYIASGKPIICLGPEDGDAAEIINQSGLGNTFNYTDISGINSFVKTLLMNKIITKEILANGFSRKNLTARLAAILKKT